MAKGLIKFSFILVEDNHFPLFLNKTTNLFDF